MPLSDGTDRASRTAPTATSNNVPVTVSEPVGSRGALLSAHARSLDSRLRVAALSERQANRRAAAHVLQLSRRISRLLPRVPTLLPVLPESGRDGRVRHYVLQAQPVVGTGGTRILTISTHSVLRFGEFDGSGRPVLWNEYDPLQPVAGWDLEIVLERLAEVLGRIHEQVEQLEARVAARARNLNALLNGSPLSRPTAIGTAKSPPPRGTAPTKVVVPVPAPAVAPIAPAVAGIAPAPTVPSSALVPLVPTPPVVASRAAARAEEHTAWLVAMAAPTDSPSAAEFEELMPELALIDLAFASIGDMATRHGESDDARNGVIEAGSGPDATESAPEAASGDASGAEKELEKEKRERRLFQHLRVR